MCISSAITTGTRNYTYCICPLYPLLCGKDITVASRIKSNVTEFRKIKIWIIYLFPNTQKINSKSGAKPMRDNKACVFCIFKFCHICKANIIFVLIFH